MLTSKQRAYLRSLANGIDTILHVGKTEIGETLIKQAAEALTARELIKGKILENSVYTTRDAATIIAEATDADVVQVIGNKFVLYKKNEKNQKIFLS